METGEMQNILWNLLIIKVGLIIQDVAYSKMHTLLS